LFARIFYEANQTSSTRNLSFNQHVETKSPP